MPSHAQIGPGSPWRRASALAAILVGAACGLAALLAVLQPPQASLAAPVQAVDQVQQAAADATGDLSVSKTHSPLSGRETGYYTITISNLSGGPITSVVQLTDTLPAQLNFTGYSWPPDGTCSEASNIVTCVYTPSVPITAGTSLPPLVLNVTQTLETQLLFTNTVIISTTEDLIATNNTDIDPTWADLRVEKTANPTSLREGGVVTFTVTVTNNGPDDTTDVVLNDILDAKLTFISATPSKGTYNSSSGVWSIGDLDFGAVATLQLVTRVKSGVGETTITNTASGLVSSLPDFNTVNNSASAQISTQKSPDLVVTKTDFCDTVTAGDSITYTVRITNTGTQAASNLLITDTFPTYLTYVSDSLTGQSGVTHTITTGKTHVWGLTSIGANESRAFNIRVGVSSPLPTGTTSVVNSIEAHTKTTEANQTNNIGMDSDVVLNAPSLSLSKTVSPVEARVGASFSFYIQVRNTGSNIISNVVIKDSFSSLLNISSVSKNKGVSSIDYSARTVTVDVGTLSPNELATVTIVAVVNSNATSTVTQSNSATVTFKHGCYTYSRSSNSVSFRLLGSTSLPGTGGMEPAPVDPVEAPSRGAWAAIASAALLALGGGTALFFALRLRSSGSEWAGWTMRMAVFLLCVAALFSLAAWGLQRWPALAGQSGQVAVRSEAPSGEAPPSQPAGGEGLAVISFQDHETLPDYPIPTPKVDPTALPAQAEADTSPPVRLLIPDLGLDAVVKYVPYDGFTWLIQGLQWELAWMGDTSWPGLGSNTGIAGHVTLRNGSDGPFRNLETLQPGSQVVVLTEKNAYTYAIKEQKVVSDIDFSVVQPSEMPQLTLITCTGWDPDMRLYLQRLIVVADLVEIEPLAVPVSSY
ncbi:MAG: sortase [Anaerolineales bacterium]|nr:sortase [Anaerolineales bacterium]